MNHEHEFVRALMKEKSFDIVTDKKIVKDNLQVDVCRDAFKFLFDFWIKYNVFPTKKTFFKKYKVFRDVKVTEPLSYYCDKIKEKLKYNLINSRMKKIVEVMETDVEGACDIANKLILDLADYETSKVVRIVKDRRKAIKEYDEVKRKGGITGHRCGWDWLDNELGGFNDGDLITIVARQKIGKSFCVCILAAEMFLRGERVLIITLEMIPKIIRRRINAYMFKLPYERFRKGFLTSEEYKRFKKGIKSLKDREDEISIVGDVYDIGSLLVRCKQYNPTVVFVDGIYLLGVGNKRGDTWERIMEISRGLKQAGLMLDIPVIATTQLSRSAAKGKLPELYHIAFGDSVGMDSDVVMSLYSNDEMRDNKKMLVRLLGSRESPVVARGMNWDLDKMNFNSLNKEETKKLLFGVGIKGDIGEEDAGGKTYFK